MISVMIEEVCVVERRRGCLAKGEGCRVDEEREERDDGVPFYAIPWYRGRLAVRLRVRNGPGRPGMPATTIGMCEMG
jgi:hypothetical protein